MRPSVVVLDLMLPDVSGIEICRRLRADPWNRQLGIIIVTARSEEYDRLLGFEAGADDYLVKPFSVRELALRVRAISRTAAPRGAPQPVQSILHWRGLALDTTRLRVHADGTDLALRPVELKILLLLMSTPDRAFTRIEVGAAIWGKTREVNPRTIDTHVSRLRDSNRSRPAQRGGSIPHCVRCNRSRPAQRGGSIPHCVRSFFWGGDDRAFHWRRVAAHESSGA